jgi:histidinol-phosphate/aromatic aminotransferase/cobyric acid decarboxylase-like protein
MYIKECSGKRNTDSDKYFRVSCRTPDENARLIQALSDVMQDLAAQKNISSPAKENAVELA